MDFGVEESLSYPKCTIIRDKSFYTGCDTVYYLVTWVQGQAFLYGLTSPLSLCCDKGRSPYHDFVSGI